MTDRELLDYVTALGIPPEEIAAAQREGRLRNLPADWLLAGDRLSINEIAHRSGTTPELVERLLVAQGMPVPGRDEPAISARMLEVQHIFEAGRALFGDDLTLQFARVFGQALTTIAEAGIALFSDNVDAELTARGASELERALAAAAAIPTLLTVPDAMNAFFAEHVLTAVRRRRLALAADSSAPMMAVAFVDLVGYTALSARVAMPELAVALGRFETAAWDLAAGRDGRVVKLVGDEAMLVAGTAADAVEIALGLCATAATDPVLDGARGAVAWGPVLQRSGDYFGPVVNLAARATKAAPPGAVMVTTEAAQGLDESVFALASTERHQLRGIDEPVELAAVTRR